MTCKNELVTRNYSVDFETRNNESVGTISGRPIVYGSETDLFLFREVIEPGALDDADLTDVRLCLNHDTNYVYARSRRNNKNSTMRLNADKDGLTFEADLDLQNSPKARDYYSAVNRKDIDKMSFMFSIDEETWEDLETDKPLRHINKIGSVVEISAVTFPAYDATEINARNLKALESAKATLDNVRSAKKEVDTSNKELALLKERLKLI